MATALALGLSDSCRTHTDAPTRKLVSGQSVRVIDSGVVKDLDGTPFFNITYCSNFEKHERDKLEAEADDVWNTFRDEAETSGVSEVSLEIWECRRRLLWQLWPPHCLLVDTGTAFSFTRDHNHEWHRRG